MITAIEKKLIRAALCFPRRGNNSDSEVLLARRKSDKLHNGRLAPPGGKMENEDNNCFRACATRETRQEVGLLIRPKSLSHLATLEIYHADGPGWWHSWKVVIFETTRWSGTPVSSKEMVDPTWFPTSCLPLSQMAPDCQLWLPELYEGAHRPGILEVKIYYADDESEKIEHYSCQRVTTSQL